jgi:hypothetical protein
MVGFNGREGSDFGSRRLAARTTDSQELKGKLAYLAPEQVDVLRQPPRRRTFGLWAW